MPIQIVEGRAPFRGHETWYRVTGDLASGKTALFVAHGGPGCTHDYVDSFKDLAADGRAVVHYDQIGNGRSTHLRDKGGDFWTVVQQPFKARELTRSELTALIDRGLQHTRGSYRGLVKTFNLPATDYKRFHAFLYQQNCNLPVGPYRLGTVVRSRRTAVASYQAAS